MSTFIAFISIIFLLVSSTPFSINDYPSVSLPINHIRVIDADTIINEDTNERIRLACINSPEVLTTKGLEATSITNNFIKNSKELTLYRFGVDLYGRTIAILRNELGVDLGRELLIKKGANYKPYGKIRLCRNLYLTPPYK